MAERLHSVKTKPKIEAEGPNAEADRRQAPRRPLKTRVALKTDRAIFFMESLDVSTTGIRLQSEVSVEVGTRCRLVPFFDDVSRLFEASGTVIRVNETTITGVRPSDASRSHLGIQFDTLSPVELEALLSILRSADPAQRVAV